MTESNLVNRNFWTSGGRTSIRLEPELWSGLREICWREDVPVRDLMQRIESQRGAGSRTGAARVYIIEYFRAAAKLSPSWEKPAMGHELGVVSPDAPQRRHSAR